MQRDSETIPLRQANEKNENERNTCEKYFVLQVISLNHTSGYNKQ